MATVPIEIIGEVREADLDTRKFGLRLDDGSTLSATFPQEFETRITLALRNHHSLRLRVRGTGARDEWSGRVERIDSVDLVEVCESQQSEGGTAKPVWEQILENAESLSDEDLAGLPTDMARNHDQYIYGDGATE